MIIQNLSVIEDIPLHNDFCNCGPAYSAGIMNGMFYTCIIILIMLVVMAFYFNFKKIKEREEDEDEEEDEFYNGEET